MRGGVAASRGTWGGGAGNKVGTGPRLMEGRAKTMNENGRRFVELVMQIRSRSMAGLTEVRNKSFCLKLHGAFRRRGDIWKNHHREWENELL